MRAFTLVFLLLALAGCSLFPLNPPVTDPLAGVTLTAMEVEQGLRYRVDTDPPLERLFLRFTGTGLAANAPECTVTSTVIECVIGQVETFYEITVAGTVTNDPALPYGVACREACHALYLSGGP